MEEVNILEALNDKFPDHCFKVLKSPLFLQDVANIIDSIILCYNERNLTVQDVVHKSVANILGSSCSGCPIEGPSYLEESMLSPTIKKSLKPSVSHLSIYSPLSSFQALEVKGFYNLYLHASIPLVVLCDGVVKILRDGHCKPVNRVIHYSFYEGNKKTTGWSDLYKINSNIDNLSELMNIHSKKIKCFYEKRPSVEMKFRAKTILAQINNFLLSEVCCSITVQYEWNSFSIKPPLDNTRTSLLISSNLSSAPSVSLTFIWKQLVLLQKYIDYLEKSSEGASNNSVIPSAKAFLDDFGVSMPLTELSADTEMRKLLNNPIGNLKPLPTQKNENVTKLTEQIADPRRPHTDIVHSLWTLLIGCDSYELLQTCFKCFFKHARSSSNLQLKLKLTQKSNITNLARMIQLDHTLLNSYSQLINPIECLIEIGIETLRHVLMTIFDFLKVPAASINIPTLPKFSEVSSFEDRIKVSKVWLNWLSRLYSALNILCCIEAALGSPQLMFFLPVIYEVVSQFCSKETENLMEIKSMMDIIDKPQRNLTLSIPVNLLSSSSADTDIFDEWMLTFRSSVGTRYVTTIFHRSPHCSLPYIDEDSNSSHGNDVNNTSLLNVTSGNNLTCLSNTLCLDNASYHLYCIESHFETQSLPLLKEKI